MKSVATLALLVGVAILALLLSIRVGAVGLDLREIVDGVRGVGDPSTVAIVQRLRLPRAVQSAMVGGALAASGATFQALLRNPLAEPYTLGLSGGAAVGAVAAVVAGWAARSPFALPLAAFAGAGLAVALVFGLARSVGRALDTRILLLAGVVVGSFFTACILLLLTFADPQSYRAAMFWLMGSFSGASWSEVATAATFFAPGLLVLMALARSLNLFTLGEETAAYLGTPVERTKRIAYGVASLVAAVAVASSGVIGFVGLVVPHTVRLLWGGDHRVLLPAAVLLGAAFLTLADALARTVAAPTELPVGVITALIGVPFFVWLLRRGVA